VKNQKGNINYKKFIFMMLLFFGFIRQVDADEIVYKYQKILVEKIKNPVIKDIEFEDDAWEEAKKIAGKYVKSADAEKPVTLIIKNNRYIDYSRGLRGIYDKDLNLVIATEYKVLVHEYLHAIFYLTGNTKFAEDELFIRSLYPAS